MTRSATTAVNDGCRDCVETRNCGILRQLSRCPNPFGTIITFARDYWWHSPSSRAVDALAVPVDNNSSSGVINKLKPEVVPEQPDTRRQGTRSARDEVEQWLRDFGRSRDSVRSAGYVNGTKDASMWSRPAAIDFTKDRRVVEVGRRPGILRNPPCQPFVSRRS